MDDLSSSAPEFGRLATRSAYRFLGRRRQRRVAFATCGLLLFTLTVAASAQESPVVPAKREAESRRVMAKWQESLRAIDGLLVEGESTKAYRKATSLLHEMTNSIVSGAGTGTLLGFATVLRAIAAVQLGRPEEGIWHWQVAQQMFPEVASLNMTAYGEVGSFLRQHPVRVKTDEPGEIKVVTGDVLPPRKIFAPTPELPHAKRGSPAVTVVVESIIAEDGTVRSPLIVSTGGELTMVCATLDRLREWRFKPATLNGEPVPVYFGLRVNFRPGSN